MSKIDVYRCTRYLILHSWKRKTRSKLLLGSQATIQFHTSLRFPYRTFQWYTVYQECSGSDEKVKRTLATFRKNEWKTRVLCAWFPTWNRNLCGRPERKVLNENPPKYTSRPLVTFDTPESLDLKKTHDSIEWIAEPIPSNSYARHLILDLCCLVSEGHHF